MSKGTNRMDCQNKILRQFDKVNKQSNNILDVDPATLSITDQINALRLKRKTPKVIKVVLPNKPSFSFKEIHKNHNKV